MPLLNWDDSFSVNISLIDRQHKKLFELANDYHDAFNSGKSEISLKLLLDGLVNYVSVHFGTEERYFAEFGYEDIEAHKREHKILILKVKDLVAKWQSRRNPNEEEISDFLLVWLKRHIFETDHKYINCFHRNGMQ